MLYGCNRVFGVSFVSSAAVGDVFYGENPFAAEYESDASGYESERPGNGGEEEGARQPVAPCSNGGSARIDEEEDGQQVPKP